MTLQSKNLVMVGLGISGDNSPPNPAQPPLADGIHLRWGFEPSKGFPWHGFYLFRREYKAPADLTATMVSLQGLPTGPMSADTLATSQGTFTSDQVISLTDNFDPKPGQPELDLEWRDYLLFIPNEIISQVEITIGLRQAIPDTAAITVTALLWDVPVAQVSVSGQTNTVVTRSLAFDVMTAIKFSAGPAAVIEIKYLTLPAARSGPQWSPIAGFPYPLSLPLTHPDYPCTPGVTEELKTARDTARQRILYGDPDQFTPDPEVIYDAGDISLVHASAIVQGQGTKWEPNLAGALLQVNGDLTAYTILSVLDPNRLVLSREYMGSSGSGRAYTIYKDPFGQLYDNLVHLVQGGTASSPVPMVDRWLPQPVYNQGTIAVKEKSATVTGSGTSWGAELKDFFIQIATYGKPVGYRIKSVDSATQLTIELPFPAPSASGLTYQILPRLGEDGEGQTAPQLPNQSPLQLALLGALHPAVAQMLGLYWVDQTTAAGKAYDYLIVAAHAAFPARTGDKAQDALDWLRTQGLDDPEIDAFIVFNQQMKPAQPLDPPTELEAYALPSGGFPETYAAGLRWDLGMHEQGELLPGKPIFYHIWRADSGTTEPTTNPNTFALLTENRPVLIARPDPLPGKELPRRSDWPPSSLRLNFIDGGLSEGWYSYKINSIDIFGRYSPNSDPIPWLKWTPPPDPRPWYWDRTTVIKVHDFSVGLVDKTPPPPPTDVESFALDPADPWLVKDAAYTSWWNALTASQWYKDLTPEQKQDLIPLRVRWLWTESEMRQAQDTREFRIYFQSGPQNALPGRVTKVTPVSGKTDESTVETDIPNNRGVDAYAGASLRIGTDNFAILGSDASSPLKLRVQSGPVITAGSVTVADGSAEVNGTNTQWSASLAGLTLKITGEQTKYRILKVDPTLQKLTLDRKYHGLSGSGKAYVISGKLPEANQPCSVVIPSGDGNTSAHALFTNFSAPTAWQERYAVVAYNSHFTNSLRPAREPMGKALRGEDASVTSNIATLSDAGLDLSGLDPVHPLFTLWLFLENDSSPGKTYRVLAVDDQAKTITLDGKPTLSTSPSRWVLGHPVRRYEVFLPSASDPYQQGLPLKPSLSEPIVYASIGVSAADDKNHTSDNAKWASGRWGGRKGNEGLMSAPAVVFRVLRKTPETPTIPTFATDKVHATHADYHSRSYYTVRWVPVTGLKTNLFRALDDALFQADWLIRSTRGALSATDADHSAIFPADWSATRRQSAASQLNAIASAAGYASLSADARVLLARLPGNAGVKDAAALDKWDWEVRRSRKSLAPNDKDYLPPEWTPAQDTAAMQLKRQTAVSKLNAITSLASYEGLSADAKRVLANLPGNERAFSQLTIEPLNPDDQTTANDQSPDDPDGAKVDDGIHPLLSSTLRRYIDTLDGRSTNCYFYRAAHVDGAHNRSALSLSTPPVYCPDVTPPKKPVLLEASAGARMIMLRWLENIEEDLDYYLLYRTDSVEAARDLRLMVLHKQIAISPTATPRTGEVAPSRVIDTTGNPVARRLQLDDVVPANEVLHYRLAAVDKSGNISEPSAVVAGRAYQPRPAPPVWNLPERIPAMNPTQVRLSWTHPDDQQLACLVERRAAGDAMWVSISGWLPPGKYMYEDIPPDITLEWQYRVRVRDGLGQTASQSPTVTLPALP